MERNVNQLNDTPKAFPSARPSDTDTMTNTALLTIASSNGKKLGSFDVVVFQTSSSIKSSQVSKVELYRSKISERIGGGECKLVRRKAVDY